MVRQLVGAKIISINLTFLLRKQDVILEAKEHSNPYDKTLREQIYLSHPVLKLKADWSTQISALFDVVAESNLRVIRLLMSYGINFAVVDEASQTTPFLWACHNRDLKMVSALIENG